MLFPTFETMMLALWAEIPERFKEGVSALSIDRNACFDEDVVDCPILGHCIPDPALEGVPDAPVVSIIQVYFGSFRYLSRRDPDFDWADEGWETLVHELRHHLEWRSGCDLLGDADDLQRENLLRHSGKPFDPNFYRYGQTLGPFLNVADDELFIELRVDATSWPRVLSAPFSLRLEGWLLRSGPRRDRPEANADAVIVGLVEAEQLIVTPPLDLARFADVNAVFRRRRLWDAPKTSFDLRWIAEPRSTMRPRRRLR